MNKLLTTITLLCLPLVSLAEVFVCPQDTSSYMMRRINGTLLTDDIDNFTNASAEWSVSSADDLSTLNVIVDTDQGFRLDIQPAYRGQCISININDSIVYQCTDKNDRNGFIDIVVIEDLDGLVTFHRTRSFPSEVNSIAGSCVKI